MHVYIKPELQNLWLAISLSCDHCKGYGILGCWIKKWRSEKLLMIVNEIYYGKILNIKCW